MSTPAPLFEPLEDIEDHIDWKDVAEVLARHILADGGFEEVLGRMDAEAVAGLDRETRLNGEGLDGWTDWREVYAAAELLRDTDRRRPEIRGELEAPRLARKLAEAQAAASRDVRSTDPTKQVLISPRIRDNVIERIVRTYGERVVAEYLHSSSGWNRHGRMDLRVVLEGMPLPARIAEALSRQKGELDEAPTRECLEHFRAIDPKAQISDERACEQGQQLLIPELECETARLTEEEVRLPGDYPEPHRLGGDTTNAAIAGQILARCPALWNSCTMVAIAKDAAPGGFDITLHGPYREDGYYAPRNVSGLALLVARRFEMMETKQGREWKRMVFKIARADHPEWSCEVSYDYSTPS